VKTAHHVCFWLGLAAVSCRGCGEDKPYTPFAVQSALPGADAGPNGALPAPNASASAAPPSQALVAPPNSRRWLLGLRELVAPDGLLFSLAVPGVAEGDFVTWLLADPADAGSRAAGELWTFPKSGEARRLTPLPGFVPSGTGCTLDARLDRTGATSVTLDVSARCERDLVARAPVRAVIVTTLGADRPLLQLRASKPAPDEVLELTSSSQDHDQDGRDDVTVGVRVGLASGPRAEAPLVFFDRTAGTARDGAEPRRTLERLAAREAARAKTKKVAEDVLATVAALRRLMASLCAESGTPRLFDQDGTPFACGSLGTAADSLMAAELDATLALGRVREAFGVLERDGWYFGTMSAVTKKRVEALVLDAIEPVTARVTPVDLRPMFPAGAHFAPLWFDASGALFVRTANGVQRVVGAGAPSPSDSSLTPPDQAVRASGRVLVAPIFSCDRSEMTLMFDAQPPAATRLLAPRPGACGRSSFDPKVMLRPIAAGDAVTALIGAALVGPDPAGAPPAPGSARSPDGRTLAVPTRFGLLLDGTKPRLLAGIPDAASLTECVPANGGTRAACVHAGKIVVIEGG
jgi:hypothetical protein